MVLLRTLGRRAERPLIIVTLDRRRQQNLKQEEVIVSKIVKLTEKKPFAPDAILTVQPKTPAQIGTRREKKRQDDNRLSKEISLKSGIIYLHDADGMQAVSDSCFYIFPP